MFSNLDFSVIHSIDTPTEVANVKPNRIVFIHKGREIDAIRSV